MSPNDIRVDLEEPTKTSSTHESLLRNSGLQIGGKINSLLLFSFHRGMFMPCSVISQY